MRFLHISDIHFNPQDDGRSTRDLRKKFREYVVDKNISNIDEIFFTGDFRHAYKQRAQDQDIIAKNAVDFLMDLANCVGIKEKNHIHIVPGNHDLTRYKWTEDDKVNSILKQETEDILNQVYENYDVFNGKFEGIVKGISINKYLRSRFDFFEKCARLLEDEIWTQFENNYIHRYRLYDKYAIVYLNTAIASGRDRDKHNLIIGTDDFDKIVHCIGMKPIIILAHDPLSHLQESERNIVKNIIKDNGSPVLWLCGDAHEIQYDNSYNIACITVGCMVQEDGVEAGFNIGEIYEDAKISIEAHRYIPRHGNWQLEEAATKRIKESLPYNFQTFCKDRVQSDDLFDTKIENRLNELFGSGKDDRIRNKQQDSVVYNKIINKILKGWTSIPAKNEITIEEYVNTILTRNIDYSGKKIMEGIHFSVAEALGIKTLIFKFSSKINLRDKSYVAGLEPLEYGEDFIINGIKRTYFIDFDTNEMDCFKRYGLYLALFTFDDAYDLVAINIGKIESNSNLLKISKKPIIIEFDHFQTCCDNSVDDSILYNSNLTQIEEMKECIFETNLNAKTIIIDPRTKEIVRRELFFDEVDKKWKANIKLKAYYGYFFSQIKYVDEGSSISKASPFDIGYGYYWGIYGLHQNKVSAVKWFMQSEEVLSYYFLSRIFLEESYLFDRRESFNYMLKAAEAGIDSAQYELGLKLESGSGCIQNFNEAFAWYLKAAKSGNIYAQYKVAEAYHEGIGVEKNKHRAFLWYLRAAKNNCDEAKYKVGCMYFLGDGIDENFDKAYIWLSESNYDEAKLLLGEIFFNIEEWNSALCFLAEAAAKGNEIATEKLGQMYLNGYGVKTDYKKAAQLLEKAAENGYSKAYEGLSEIYMKGLGVEKDSVRAQLYLEKSKAKI